MYFSTVSKWRWRQAFRSPIKTKCPPQIHKNKVWPLQGALIYKTDASNQGLSVTIFLQKRDIGWQIRKGGHWVWNCTRSGNFNFFFKFSPRFAKFLKIRRFRRKILIEKAQIGGYWMWSYERGRSVTNRRAWHTAATWSAPWGDPKKVLMKRPTRILFHQNKRNEAVSSLSTMSTSQTIKLDTKEKCR